MGGSVNLNENSSDRDLLCNKKFYEGEVYKWYFNRLSSLQKEYRRNEDNWTSEKRKYLDLLRANEVRVHVW